jgi:hypothetical protein
MDARYIVLLRIQSTLILNRLTISTRTAAAGAGSALSVVDPDCGACSNDEDDLCYGCQSCKAGVVDALKC